MVKCSKIEKIFQKIFMSGSKHFIVPKFSLIGKTVLFENN